MTRERSIITAARCRALRWYVFIAIAYLIAMAIAFRQPLASGFDLGFGDRGDAIIEISILEHWKNVFSGNAENWRQLFYFHPWDDTLGYNDGYFLYGVIYSFWRQWFDPFLSDTLNIAVWKSIGFFATYVLISHVIGWERALALLAALLLTIANGMVTRAGHAQLQTVALLPVSAIIALALARAALAGEWLRTMGLASLLASLLGAWFMTAYYMAWFTLYFAGFFAMFLIIETATGGIIASRQHVVRIVNAAVIFAVAFGLAIIPFLIVYLPKLKQTSGHNYAENFYYLAYPFDILNVGPNNLLWGWIVQLARSYLHNIYAAPGNSDDLTWINGEHHTGFPLIMMVLTLISIMRVLLNRYGRFSRVFRCYTAAVGISWLTIFKVSTYSLWSLSFLLVPGATGLRAPLRFQLWLILPILLLIIGAWRREIAALSSKRPLLAIAMSLLLVFEQLTVADAAQLSRSRQTADLSIIPTPPQDCAAFYVVSARQSSKPDYAPLIQALYPHNVDAMLLSELWKRPTINGFSTFNPPDWNFGHPLDDDYDERAIRYARSHNLRPLCRLDARVNPYWRRIWP